MPNFEDWMKHLGRGMGEEFANPFGDDADKRANPFMPTSQKQVGKDTQSFFERDLGPVLDTRLMPRKEDRPIENPWEKWTSSVANQFSPQAGGGWLSPASWFTAGLGVADWPRYTANWLGWKAGLKDKWDLQSGDWMTSTAEDLFDSKPGLMNYVQDPVPDGIMSGAGWFLRNLANPAVLSAVGAMGYGAIQDIRSDPLTYTSFGAGPVLKQVAKYLNSPAPLRASAGAADEIADLGTHRIFGEITPERIPEAADTYILRHLDHEADTITNTYTNKQTVESMMAPGDLLDVAAALDSADRLREIKTYWSTPDGKVLYEQFKNEARANPLDRTGVFTREEKGFQVFTPENRRRILEAPSAEDRLRAVADMSVKLEHKIKHDMPGTRFHLPGFADNLRIPGFSGKWWDPGILPQTLYNAPRRLMTNLPTTTKLGSRIIPPELMNTKVTDIQTMDNVKGVPITPQLKAAAKAAVDALRLMDPDIPAEHVRLGDIEPRLMAEGPIPGATAKYYGIDRPIAVTESIYDSSHANPSGGKPMKAEFVGWLDSILERTDGAGRQLDHETVYSTFRPVYDFLYQLSEITPLSGLTGNTQKELKWTLNALDEWVAKKRVATWSDGDPMPPATTSPSTWSPSHRYFQQLANKVTAMLPAAMQEVEEALIQLRSSDPATSMSGLFAAGRLSDPAIESASGAIMGRYLNAMAPDLVELLRLQPPSWIGLDKTAQQRQILDTLTETYQLYNAMIDETSKRLRTDTSFIGMIHALIRADIGEWTKIVSPPSGIRAGWTPGMKTEYFNGLTSSPMSLGEIMGSYHIVPGSTVGSLTPPINRADTGVYQFNRGIGLDPFQAWEIRIAADFAGGDLGKVLAAIHPRLDRLGMTYQVAGPAMGSARLASPDHGNHLITIFAKSAQDLVLTAKELDEILTHTGLVNPGYVVRGAEAMPGSTSGRIFYRYGSPSGELGYLSPPVADDWAQFPREVRPPGMGGAKAGVPGPRVVGPLQSIYMWNDGSIHYHPEWLPDPFGGTITDPAILEVVVENLKDAIKVQSDGMLDDAAALSLASSLARLTIVELDQMAQNMGKYAASVTDVTGRAYLFDNVMRAMAANMEQWASNSQSILHQYMMPMVEDITRMREIHFTNRSKSALAIIWKSFQEKWLHLAKHVFRNLGQPQTTIDDMEMFQFSKQTNRLKGYNRAIGDFVMGEGKAVTGFDGLIPILNRFGANITVDSWNKTKLAQLSEGYTRVTQIRIYDEDGNLHNLDNPINKRMYDEHIKGREMMANALGLKDLGDPTIDLVNKEISEYLLKLMDEVWRIEAARGLNMVYRPDYLPIFLNGSAFAKRKLMEHLHGSPAIMEQWRNRARNPSSFFMHNVLRKHPDIGSIWREIISLNANKAMPYDVFPELDIITIVAKRLENHYLALSTLDFLDKMKWAHPDKVIPVKYTAHQDEIGDFLSIMDRVPRTDMLDATNVPEGVPFLGVMGEFAAADYVRAEMILPEMRGWILRSDIAEYFKSFHPYQGIFQEGDIWHSVYSFVFNINQWLKKVSIIWDLVMLKNLALLAIVGDLDVGKFVSNVATYRNIKNHPLYMDGVNLGIFPAGNLEISMPMRELTYGFIQKTDPSWLSRMAPDTFQEGLFKNQREATRMGPLGVMRNAMALKTEFGPFRWVTWDLTDKFMRLTLYEQALELGMTKLDAARTASNAMIDYQMRWHSESMKKIGYGLFPFYAWMMGNMYQHIPKMLGNPRMYAIMARAENLMNQAATGQDIEENPSFFKGAIMTPFYNNGEMVAILPQKPWGAYERLTRDLFKTWAERYPGLPIPSEIWHKLVASSIILRQFFFKRMHSFNWNFVHPVFFGQRDLTKMENEAYTKDELEQFAGFFEEWFWGLYPILQAMDEDVSIGSDMKWHANDWALRTMGLGSVTTSQPRYRWEFPWEGILNLFLPTRHLPPGGGYGD